MEKSAIDDISVVKQKINKPWRKEVSIILCYLSLYLCFDSFHLPTSLFLVFWFYIFCIYPF